MTYSTDILANETIEALKNCDLDTLRDIYAACRHWKSKRMSPNRFNYIARKEADRVARGCPHYKRAIVMTQWALRFAVSNQKIKDYSQDAYKMHKVDELTTRLLARAGVQVKLPKDRFIDDFGTSAFKMIP